MKQVVKNIYQHRQDYIVIGLTGKIGSGCITSAEILEKNVDDIVLP